MSHSVRTLWTATINSVAIFCASKLFRLCHVPLFVVYQRSGQCWRIEIFSVLPLFSFDMYSQVWCLGFSLLVFFHLYFHRSFVLWCSISLLPYHDIGTLLLNNLRYFLFFSPFWATWILPVVPISLTLAVKKPQVSWRKGYESVFKWRWNTVSPSEHGRRGHPPLSATLSYATIFAFFSLESYYAYI